VLRCGGKDGGGARVAFEPAYRGVEDSVSGELARLMFGFVEKFSYFSSYLVCVRRVAHPLILLGSFVRARN
jgi:hypothetical protein